MSLNQFIADGNLQVTKFGVRFINKEYILHLKQREDCMIYFVYDMVRASEESLKFYENRLFFFLFFFLKFFYVFFFPTSSI
ncbi:hypothetical protein HanRHA438_Chr05g0229061 [Helianthus annuus]|nr:hypothetical protein HanRHA438_Chr05g0229061 [Helianthus annuus]